jgi:predicted DsbA family dithiol-disulfide isomerase
MNIEVWSDIVCPWCYIGKRRLETALERFERRDAVRVIWRSYRLDPNAPRVSAQSTREMLARKYGVSLGQADGMQARVTGIAAEEGLEYHLEKTLHFNTFDAHRLLHFAKSKDLQEELKERLMRAHFTEGRSPADAETLVSLAGEVGLDAAECRAVLESGAHADDVRADEALAREYEIRGVPFFVFGGKYGVSGAQAADTLLEVMEKAWSETRA